MISQPEIEIQARMESALRKLRKLRDEPDHIGSRQAFVFCREFWSLMKNGKLTNQVKGLAERCYAEALEDDLMSDQEDDVILFSEFLAQIKDIVSGNKVKFEAGHNLNRAIELATICKIRPPLMKWCNVERFILLAKVCFQLQIMHGKDKPFFITGEDAGKIIGKKQKAGDRALKTLCSEGTIRLHKKGHTGHASEYYYNT